jgi:regulatory protein
VNTESLESRALRYLARREHSRLELEQKLATDTQSAAEALSSLLDKLEQKGFLSAERFVEQMITIRRPRFGCQRIVYELKQKGIDEHLIANVLPELKETEFDAAFEVWRKKFGTLPINVKERGKQMRFMMSRGFSAEVIGQVLSHAEQEEA